MAYKFVKQLVLNVIEKTFTVKNIDYEHPVCN